MSTVTEDSTITLFPATYNELIETYKKSDSMSDEDFVDLYIASLDTCKQGFAYDASLRFLREVLAYTVDIKSAYTPEDKWSSISILSSGEVPTNLDECIRSMTDVYADREITIEVSLVHSPSEDTDNKYEYKLTALPA